MRALKTILLMFAVAMMICRAATPGSGPEISVPKDSPRTNAHALPKPNWIDQSANDVLRKSRGCIAPLLEGRVRPQPLPNLATDLQHEPSSNVTHNACRLRSHRSFLRLPVSGHQLGQHLLHDDR